MSKNHRLQIPISLENKQALDHKAEKEGFSSSNDLVRLLIHKFLKNDLSIQVVATQHTPMLDAETEQRVYQSMKEIEQGDCDEIDFAKNPNAFLDSYKG